MDFYMNVLGFVPDRLEEYKAGNAFFPSVRINPTTIIDFLPLAKEGDKPTGHICIALQKVDFDKLVTRLAKHGITVDPPKNRYGAQGQGWSIYISDPENNQLEFRWYD